MNEFLIELAELLKKHNACIFAHTHDEARNTIGIEKDGKDLEIDNGCCEVYITTQLIKRAIK